MKELLCRAFCGALELTKVPVGFALRTPFSTSDGDPIIVYMIKEHYKWRLEDDGTQVPMLEANGVDLTRGTRRAAFEALLKEYGVHFDRDSRTLRTPLLAEDAVGAAAFSMATLVLRLQDLAILSVTNVRSAFREDAIAAIHNTFDGRANVEDKSALAEEMIGSGGDIVVRVPDRTPLSIFIGTSEERALHALVTKMDAEKYRHLDANVVLLIEKSRDNPISEKTLGLAFARLDRVLSFRGLEQDAMAILQRLAGLSPVPEVLQ